MITHYNQIPIHYTIKGKGPCIVLLHGFLLSSSIWDELAPKLSKKNKVIIIDLPGHGKSGCLAETHTMELIAEVVNFILEENNIDQASFIGHSMGGYISLAFTEKYGSKVHTLVLLNSSTEEDSPEKKINRDSAIKIIKYNQEIFVKMAILALFPAEKQREFQHYIDKFTEEAIGFKVEGINAAIKGMKNRKDRTSVLTSFKGNKFIISGIKDPIIPFSNSKKTATKSHTKLLKVNSGHMSINENINEIVKIMHLIDFL
jgi:pimeloyl-ACP methyl ester carboxylesterase